MATTRIIPMHLNKGKTIRQCLSDRLNYGKNPEKTKEGQLTGISGVVHWQYAI